MADDLALLREWLEILPEGRFELFSGRIAEDFALRLPYPPPGVPGEFLGREVVRERLQTTAKGRSPIQFSDLVLRRTDDPELFVTTGNGQATMNSGKVYRNSYVMFTRIRDGMVLEHIEYLNPLKVMEAMGD
jgi:ketosteroid isomerase-like protein